MKSKKMFLKVVLLICIMLLISISPSPASTMAAPQEDVPTPGEGSRFGDKNISGKYETYFVDIPGITFTPTDSRLTYKNGGNGCLETTYSGSEVDNKSYVAPLLLPEGSTLYGMDYSYWNGMDGVGDSYVNLYCQHYRGGPVKFLGGATNSLTDEGWHYYSTGFSEPYVIDRAYYCWLE